MNNFREQELATQKKKKVTAVPQIADMTCLNPTPHRYLKRINKLLTDNTCIVFRQALCVRLHLHVYCYFYIEKKVLF